MKQSKQLRLIIRDMNIENFPEFKSEKNEVDFPIQLDLFYPDNFKKRAHISMGLFYELAIQALFGGALKDQIHLQQDKKDNILIKPDIYNKEKKQIIESKAIRSGHQFNILDGQINRYKEYQKAFLDFYIYYAVWRHTQREIKNYSKDPEALFEALARKTLCLILFPLSIIDEMHASDSFNRYETDRWDHCTRIRNDVINMPLTNIQKFSNLINRNGNITSSLSKSPKLKVAGFEIKTFPIIEIVDLKYGEWKRSLLNEVEEIPF